MESAGGAITRTNEADLVCMGLEASVMVAVRLKVPLTAGVPETTPLEPRVRPEGRVPPVTDQV